MPDSPILLPISSKSFILYLKRPAVCHQSAINEISAEWRDSQRLAASHKIPGLVGHVIPDLVVQVPRLAVGETVILLTLPLHPY